MRKLNVVFVFFLLAFIYYGITIKNFYSLDDNLVVYNVPKVMKGIKGIPEILTTRYAQHGEHTYGYRPVTQISFALEVSLWGLNPHMSHLINVILYALCGVLLFYFLIEVFPSRGLLAYLTTIFFIIHPIHSEVVASLKNREILLSFIFGISAAKMFYKIIVSENLKNGKLKLAGIISLYLLAIFTKLSAWVFLFYPLLLALAKKEIKWQQIIKWILIIIFIGIFLVAVFKLSRILIISEKGERNYQYIENPLFFEKGVEKRILTGLSTFLFYVEKVVVPYPLLSYYGYPVFKLPDNWMDWRVITGGLILLCLGVLTLWRLIIKRSIDGVGIGIFMISILPFLNITVPLPGIVAERLLFEASIGPALILGYLFEQLIFKIAFVNSKIKSVSFKFLWLNLWSKMPGKALVFIMLIIIVITAIYVNNRNSEWKDFLTLYEADLSKSPNNIKLHLLIAQHLIVKTLGNYSLMTDRHLQEKIEKHYYQALSLYSEIPVAWNNLGSFFLLYQNKADTAIYCFQKALSLRSKYPTALFNLGRAYETKGDTENAIKYYCRAINQGYYQKEAFFYLLIILYKKKMADTLLHYAQIAVNKLPDWDFSYVALANSYALKNDTQKAIYYFQKAYEINPNNYQVSSHLKKLYSTFGKSKDTILK